MPALGEVTIQISGLCRGVNSCSKFKKEIKKIAKKNDVVESTEATKALDRDLKLGAIFGAVGVVGLILGGASAVFFYIGGIALIIGVVFFVRWLIRQ